MTWQTILLIIYEIIVISTIIHVVMDNRQPAKTMAWVMVIWFLPVVGIIAYMFFGVNTRRERMVSQRSMDQLTKRSMFGFVEQHDLQLPEDYKPVIDLFVNESFSLPFNNNKVEILTDGYEFFPALLSDIASARSHIHIDIYIFEDDALGRLVSDALIAKAREGVEVRVLFDDVGCWSVKNRFFERMRVEGIEVEPFLPVRFPTFARKVNYRNHRKIIVIDGSVVLSDRKYYPSIESINNEQCVVQTVTSAPLAAYPAIMQGYVRIILAAKKYIYIQTPYFLPTDAVFFALKTAAASGVDVRVMVPRKTDGWFVEWGSRSYLREAQEAGIQILLYEPRFLHAKMLVCDDGISTCGSTNIDFRSFLNNFEGNLFVYDHEVALQMKETFLRDAETSVSLTSMLRRMHPRFFTRLGESLMRVLSPLL